jgi:hypothetical protein
MDGAFLKAVSGARAEFPLALRLTHCRLDVAGIGSEMAVFRLARGRGQRCGMTAIQSEGAPPYSPARFGTGAGCGISLARLRGSSAAPEAGSAWRAGRPMSNSQGGRRGSGEGRDERGGACHLHCGVPRAAQLPRVVGEATTGAVSTRQPCSGWPKRRAKLTLRTDADR